MQQTWWDMDSSGRVYLIQPGQPRRELSSFSYTVGWDMAGSMEWVGIDGARGEVAQGTDIVFTRTNGTTWSLTDYEIVAGCECPGCVRFRERQREEESYRVQRDEWRRCYSPWETALRQDELYSTQKLEAERRSRELLCSHLSPLQLEQFNANNWFVVQGSDGMKYSIHPYTVYNVKALRPNGKDPIAEYCAAPLGVPVYDSMLAQMLMLETDAWRFTEIANKRFMTL